MTGINSQAASGASATHGRHAVSNEGVAKLTQSSVNGESSQPSGASLNSRTGSVPQGFANPPSETKSVTTQPLFNGLLLISIVVNVYLIFWLKNLRLQYHEMVAAKRMASSNGSSS